MWGACWLTICGNIVVYITILAYIMKMESDESDYGMW